MLARCYSLKEKSDFEEVEKKGEVIQSESFGMAFLKRKDMDYSRFGFVVSTKIAKDAVQRNRIKRSMGEAIRQSLFEMAPGFNVVFLAKQKSAQTSTSDIMAEVRTVLKKAKMVK